ncbi:ABC transporter substrate-binding protein [Corallincola platygyrae]|uniref:ABC transporter substrate-binding protein n=1 Tax=Corallincola platygyrae TaxID=1193278 RepID=A0ABW4XQP0_9GAMM
MIFRRVVVLKLLTTSTVLLLSLLSSAVFAQHRILIIDSYHPEYAWVEKYRAGLEATLAGKADLYYLSLNAKQLPSEKVDENAETAWARFNEIKPDLVIIADDEAVARLAVRIAETKVPTVYFGVNADARSYGLLRSEWLTGFIERPLFKRGIAFLTTLLTIPPKRVLVLWDNSGTAQRVIEQSFAGETNPTVNGIELEHRLIADENSWKAAVLAAKEQGFDAVIVGLYQSVSAEAGGIVHDRALLSWTSSHSALPLFCFWDFAIGANGTIGGLVMSAESQGSEAARRALLILNRRPVSHFPASVAQGSFVFSRAQLEKWQIILPDKIKQVARFVD